MLSCRLAGERVNAMTTQKKPHKTEPAAPAMMTTQEVGVLIEALRSEFGHVTDGQDILREEIGSLKEHMIASDKKIDSLTGMMAKNSTDITYLKLEITGIHHELTTINGKLARMEDKFDQEFPRIDARLTALETKR